MSTNSPNLYDPYSRALDAVMIGPRRLLLADS